MANKKISELNNATLPLSGTEQIAIVQGGETKKIEANNFKSDKLDKDSNAGVERAYIVNPDGTQGMKPTSDFGTTESFAQSKWMYNDFYSASNPLNREPFMGVAVNGGSLGMTLEYLSILSGTSANGGFRMITNNATTRIKAGLTQLWTISLSPDSTSRDRVIRDGFHTATNQTAPTDGVYIEIIGSDLTFKATASGVTTASSTITLVSGVNDLYEILIHCYSTTHVRCIVNKIGTGVVLDTDAGTPITTNIPTAGLNNGIVAHIVTAGANNNICHLDYGGLGPACPTFLLDRL